MMAVCYAAPVTTKTNSSEIEEAENTYLQEVVDG